MADFSWSELAKKMFADLASGNWRTKAYDIDGMHKEFFSPKEFLEMFEYVQEQALDESGGYTLRTSARAGDR